MLDVDAVAYVPLPDVPEAWCIGNRNPCSCQTGDLSVPGPLNTSSRPIVSPTLSYVRMDGEGTDGVTDAETQN